MYNENIEHKKFVEKSTRKIVTVNCLVNLCVDGSIVDGVEYTKYDETLNTRVLFVKRATDFFNEFDMLKYPTIAFNQHEFNFIDMIENDNKTFTTRSNAYEHGIYHVIDEHDKLSETMIEIYEHDGMCVGEIDANTLLSNCVKESITRHGMYCVDFNGFENFHHESPNAVLLNVLKIFYTDNKYWSMSSFVHCHRFRKITLV